MGDIVRRERLRRRLSQIELAKRARLSQGWVSKMEAGLGFEAFLRVTRVNETLGITPAEIAQRFPKQVRIS